MSIIHKKHMFKGNIPNIQSNIYQSIAIKIKIFTYIKITSLLQVKAWLQLGAGDETLKGRDDINKLQSSCVNREQTSC